VHHNKPVPRACVHLRNTYTHTRQLPLKDSGGA
jgi:hypothetical protein